MKPEGSLPHSQEPTITVPYLRKINPIDALTIISWISILKHSSIVWDTMPCKYGKAAPTN
jgi:hypothetical protein